MKLEQSVIKELLKKENPVVLELGANIGEDTVKFLSEFKDIRIYCFEPDPRCIKALKKKIHDERCVLIEAAVSGSNGFATLNMSAGWPSTLVPRRYRVLGLGGAYQFFMRNAWHYSSSIKEAHSNPADAPWLTFDQKVQIRTVRLDSWAKENNIKAIDFIWSDIQGAEKDMIEGAGDTLKNCKYLYTEYGEVASYSGALTKEETVDLLQKHHFEVMPQYSSCEEKGNLLFRNRDLLGVR